MNGCVVNVATGRYVQGQNRLRHLLVDGPDPTQFLSWNDPAAIGAPSHQDVPYAFKAYALKEAARLGHTALLWADACIVPHAQLSRIWDYATEHGAWFSRNGWTNSEWTAKAALEPLGVTEEENARIPHVVATAFALDLNHPTGRAFLDEYFRLASETRAFCGPWTGGVGVQHRHDQSCASVIAWRLGIPLTDPPDYFAYKGGEMDKTVLVADGAY